jgi:hypothetical protein
MESAMAALVRSVRMRLTEVATRVANPRLYRRLTVSRRNLIGVLNEH